MAESPLTIPRGTPATPDVATAPASFTPPAPVTPLASTAIPVTCTSSRPVIDIRHIHRIFESEAGLAHILHDVSLTVSPGEFVAITGPSGSGKSTLMNILGCLDTPTSGTYLLEGLNVAEPPMTSSPKFAPCASASSSRASICSHA